MKPIKGTLNITKNEKIFGQNDYHELTGQVKQMMNLKIFSSWNLQRNEKSSEKNLKICSRNRHFDLI